MSQLKKRGRKKMTIPQPLHNQVKSAILALREHGYHEVVAEPDPITGKKPKVFPDCNCPVCTPRKSKWKEIKKYIKQDLELVLGN